MPGIYGVVSLDGSELPTTLQRMRQKLRSGFEKASGCWMDEAAGAGFGLDALGDHDSGVQPVIDNARNLVLFLDGVIYNKDELRKELINRGHPAKDGSPASIALNLYEDCGPVGFAKLHGMFILVLWDRLQRRITLANDRFGLRPFYYTQQGSRFAFASEVKALLALPFVHRKVDDAGVADLFAFDQLIGDKTLFEEIRYMKPGSILTFQDGDLQIQSYWNSNFCTTKRQTQARNREEEMVTLLGQSLRRCLESWPDMGLSLSGGLDSKTLLAIATKRLGIKIPTYSYGLARSNDVIQARAAARCAKTRHHEKLFDDDYLSKYAEWMVNRTEGLHNCLGSHGFSLLEMVPPGQVIMLGTGAESFFMTFRSYKKFSIAEGEDLTYPFFKSLNHIFPQERWPELFSEAYYPQVEERAFHSLALATAKFQGYPPDDIIDSVILEARQRYSFHGIYMINHRFEYCVPYYDYDLVDFALALPDDLRWDRKLQNAALCLVSPDLAKLPGGPLFVVSPYRKFWNRGIYKGRRWLDRLRNGKKDSALTKPSGTFTNLHSLLRGANRNWVERVLLDDRTLGRGYFKPQAIRSAVEEHMGEKRNLGFQLGTLLTFELWHRQFVD